MRHRSKKKTLGRTAAPRKALYRMLAVNLILHGRMTTSVTKAKAIRPYVERCVTTGKIATLASRRLLFKRLVQESAVKKVLTELSPKYLNRQGGYTRIIKLGRRLGDAGEMAIIEFV